MHGRRTNLKVAAQVGYSRNLVEQLLHTNTSLCHCQHQHGPLGRLTHIFRWRIFLPPAACIYRGFQDVCSTSIGYRT